ncbi:MAG: nucleotidyltransferase family protein [Pirellulales bacterium]|nr:nucleotidyltransferase family protein [Pirellulales bacterium]
MMQSEILKILQALQEDLHRRFGVKSLSLYGSVARNQDTDASDIDLLVEFDRSTGLFGLIELQEHLEKHLGRKVDLGTPGSLKPRIRDRVLAEAIHVN